jgi:hypothetical protein
MTNLVGPHDRPHSCSITLGTKSKNRDRSVSHGMDGPGLVPGTAFRPTLGDSHSLISNGYRIKRKGREADHPPFSAEISKCEVVTPLPIRHNGFF